MVYFVFSELWWKGIFRFVDIGRIVYLHCLEVIVRFVDIDDIIRHHSLNFLFINNGLQNTTQKKQKFEQHEFH